MSERASSSPRHNSPLKKNQWIQKPLDKGKGREQEHGINAKFWNVRRKSAEDLLGPRLFTRENSAIQLALNRLISSLLSLEHPTMSKENHSQGQPHDHWNMKPQEVQIQLPLRDRLFMTLEDCLECKEQASTLDTMAMFSNMTWPPSLKRFSSSSKEEIFPKCSQLPRYPKNSSPSHQETDQDLIKLSSVISMLSKNTVDVSLSPNVLELNPPNRK
ncbi:hypothetical protein BDQ17DRAFT_1430792 [Cyathus striatus]|nr:hypothetical protein BDQ17DRAFT_1430792 [Cyathus striatus]